MLASIAISTEKIIDVILARSALRHLLDPERPPLLTLDRRPALKLLIENVISRLAMAIGAGLKTDDSGDITVLSAEFGPGSSPSSIRAVAEYAIACDVLSQAYAGTDKDFSDSCLTDRNIAEASLRAATSGSAAILPSPF